MSKTKKILEIVGIFFVILLITYVVFLWKYILPGAEQLPAGEPTEEAGTVAEPSSGEGVSP